MPPTVSSNATGLTITNPLVLYRALVATKRIEPDLAQHRLAIHLQKIYHRLKDYEPAQEYARQLQQLRRAVGTQQDSTKATRKGIFASLTEQKEKADALSLVRQLSSHESAINLQSPQGLLLYGEVGTGKSMLVDLLADSLPNKKKRRYHFNTFMLETFARLEALRRQRLSQAVSSSSNGVDRVEGEEHSMLRLARDLIATSPILFLDEFQLPDRAASKILSNLLTSFFHLGGVLIATSNRMPEELANASGVEFTPPPASRLGLLGDKWGLLGSGRSQGRGENLFARKGDVTAFLEVLRARCEILDMEGKQDWRRRDFSEEDNMRDHPDDDFQGLEPMIPGNWGLGYEQSAHTRSTRSVKAASVDSQSQTPSVEHDPLKLPQQYFVDPPFDTVMGEADRDSAWKAGLRQAVLLPPSISSIPWQSSTLYIYGRPLMIPQHHSGAAYFTFAALCCSNLGPADYISIASNFHTLILTDVPILTLVQKNEARRLITLLDALYEARCKLLIRASAGPDDLFFPETTNPAASSNSSNQADDGTYAETFSEIYQDQNAPFRPNISSYQPSSSPPNYAASPLPSIPYSSTLTNPSTRSILADEDSDFGPVYGAGRSSSSNAYTQQARHPDEPSDQYRNTRGLGDGLPGAGNEIGSTGTNGVDFQRTAAFTGEDERFAYKRARSRLWEMCGRRWWARGKDGEDWWTPLPLEARAWERRGPTDQTAKSQEKAEQINQRAGQGDNEQEGQILPKVGERGIDGGKPTAEEMVSSPFRTMKEPPPKIPWVHAWGMMTWGKKAGAWGKGPEGLPERRAKKEEK
ncbi:hypothetical protein MMC25_006500 [Agyrium rufum]|nr:hypothetical protein [Agyrium rufum]